MPAFPDIFTIIDTETTGMRPPFSRVIDLGIIRVEHGEIVDRFETLLNPGISIPSYIRRFTNIEDEDLADAPAFEEVALQVEALFKDSVFVAHNAPFDYSFLKSEFRRIDMEFSAETLCSVRLSRALFPKERSHSLESIINRYDIPVKARHRAMPDAQAVWDFFKHVEKIVDEDEIARAVNAVRQGGDSPAPRVARDTFTDLPDSAGVYFFYGPEQELLYVGKSKHVRTRARSHFHASGGKKEERLKDETTSIASMKTSGELSALILEAALIKKESPLYNRALRKRKKLVIARAVRDERGYDRIVLERTEQVTPETGVLSVFRTTTQGKSTLRLLAREHRLCLKLLGIENGPGPCFGYQEKSRQTHTIRDLKKRLRNVVCVRGHIQALFL
jgi:DNA polymerase-3 subunit epsilon